MTVEALLLLLILFLVFVLLDADEAKANEGDSKGVASLEIVVNQFITSAASEETKSSSSHETSRQKTTSKDENRESSTFNFGENGADCLELRILNAENPMIIVDKRMD
ncbi:hypothetical protein KIN20_009772 [Parelaphostrongylus tenuis]|uniref:Uncharacterized protein n=1 Tax=Parelaphostrongylus tenuis TaxID=148309 RepID=A0AAD5MT03_PARTN|nr:hypothetical protein KIN20_009772 [Parelaphostrongylus tenuis]